MTGREEFDKAFPLPVLYQIEQRQISGGDSFYPWRECTKETYEWAKLHPISGEWQYKSRALYGHPHEGVAIVPVERLTAEWANKNVVVPPEVKGRVMSEMFWRGVYAMLAAAKEKGE